MNERTERMGGGGVKIIFETKASDPPRLMGVALYPRFDF